MTTALILRLEAPLMSFGAPQIDQIGKTRRFPALSQIAGLLGNALGYTHAETVALNRLQDRLRLASLLLKPGRELVDYQTVDLGQPHLVQTGWTTRGRREDRGKGEATTGTHIRYRHYVAGAVVLAAVQLEPADEAPNLAALAAALQAPARPLFIGRKTCLPAGPLLVGEVKAKGLADALEAALQLNGGPEGGPHVGPFDAELPADECSGAGVTERVVDRRDWRNQFHGGERLVRQVSLPRPGAGVR